MPVVGSRWCVPWYSWVPWGTEARKRDVPLWLSEEPHWRSGERIALKMWLALRRAEVCSGEGGDGRVLAEGRWGAGREAQVRGWECIVKGIGWILRV